MADLNLFIPLMKVDAARRLVYGVVTAERPDRGNEICDYATTKPYYQEWSAEFHKASAGKSLGNLRAMHGKVAAGRLESILFNDAEKKIEICAKVVDEAEWAKVEAGVYTGFSQGGGYVRRWPDAKDPTLTRYTANPSEISLVDLPCLPDATFSLVKADGVVETMRFQPQTSALAVSQVWIASDGKTFKKKAEALAHQLALENTRPALGALERLETDLGVDTQRRRRRQARERLTKFVGDETLDAAKAFAALQMVFQILQSELDEGEEEETQVAALKGAIERLKQFIGSELLETGDAGIAEKPLAQAAPSVELARALEAATLERDAHKAQLDQLAPRLEKLAARVDEIGRQPLPPPMLAGTRAVDKGGDLPTHDLVAMLSRMNGEERAALLIKVAQSQPAPLR
jgi:hypothetical protein